MSLFERIQNKRYDLQEASSGGKSKGDGPVHTNFNKNNKNKKTDKFEDITGEGIKKGDYPKTRKELEAKRKEYGINKDGVPSKEGIKRYAEKAKQLKSGSNVPVKVTQADLNRAKKNMVGGQPVKNKVGTTTGRYGGKLNPPATKTEIDATKKAIETSKTISAKGNVILPKVYEKGKGFRRIIKKLPRKTKVIDTATRRIQLLKPKIIPPKVPPKVKGNLFDPTGRIADETKKQINPSKIL